MDDCVDEKLERLVRTVSGLIGKERGICRCCGGIPQDDQATQGHYAGCPYLDIQRAVEELRDAITGF